MGNKGLKNICTFIFGFLAVSFMLFTQTIGAAAKDGYFVEVKDKVYFRKYGKEALEKTALWGYYFNYPKGDGGSFVASYDKSTGQVKALFDDDGGRLYYDDKRFYFENKQGEDNDYKSIVYAVDKIGKNTKVLYEYGTILELSKRGYLAVQTFNMGTASTVEIIKNAHRIFRINTGKGMEAVQYIGIADDYLIYGILHYQDGKLLGIDVYGKGLNVTSKPIKLGSLNMEDKFVDGIDIGNVIFKKGKVYFSVFCFDGSGHFISEGFVYSADPMKNNSLKTVTGDVYGKYQKIPYFTVNNKGRVKLSEYKKNEVFQNKNSVYLFKKDNDKKLIVKDIRKLFGKSAGGEYEVASADYIDGAVYMIINKQKREPSEDIGWREAYRVLERYYVRVPLDLKTEAVKTLYTDKF